VGICRRVLAWQGRLVVNAMKIIETPRLLLRIPELKDLDRWADFAADEEAMRYIGGVMSRSMTWRSIMCMIGAWHATGVAMFSVIEKSTGQWLGRIGPWEPEGWPGHEVGWSLHRDAWGKGYALEAAIACMDYAVDVLQWQNIIHTIDVNNLSSQNLAARLGSKLIGPVTLPAPHQELRIDAWGQSADDWCRNRKIIGTQRA
jgi:RimJ/RimL family protein N-acetyltransferase